MAVPTYRNEGWAFGKQVASQMLAYWERYLAGSETADARPPRLRRPA